MQLREIIMLVVYAVVLLGTIVSFVTALVKSIKKYKAAKTEAEQEAALNDMTSAAQGFIADAEKLYADAEKLYEDYTKQLVGTGAPVTTSVKSGALKKDSVMAKLSQYALEKGYVFDSEYWSTVIDQLVELTKNVNAKKKTA